MSHVYLGDQGPTKLEIPVSEVNVWATPKHVRHVTSQSWALTHRRTIDYMIVMGLKAHLRPNLLGPIMIEPTSGPRSK